MHEVISYHQKCPTDKDFKEKIANGAGTFKWYRHLSTFLSNALKPYAENGLVLSIIDILAMPPVYESVNHKVELRKHISVYYTHECMNYRITMYGHTREKISEAVANLKRLIEKHQPALTPFCMISMEAFLDFWVAKYSRDINETKFGCDFNQADIESETTAQEAMERKLNKLREMLIVPVNGLLGYFKVVCIKF